MLMDNNEFRCEICNKVFSTKGNLTSHKNKKTPCIPAGSNPYQCKLCGKIFNKKSHLDDHMDKKLNACVPTNYMIDLIKNQKEFQLQLQETLKTQLQQLQITHADKNTINTTQNINNIQTTNNTLQNNQSNVENSNNTLQNMSNACLINYVVNNYPNAKNIEDCIKLENIPKSLLIECEDMYFNEGSMKIFKTLCDLGEEHRPIHCTDASRGNFIYKTNDVWKIDVGGEKIKSHFFPVIQEAYTHVHKQRIKNNPGNSTVISNYLTEMTTINIKKICQKTLKRLSNDFLAKNSKNSKLITMQKNKINK